MEVGNFGRVTFQVSETQLTSISNQITRSYKSKISDHSPIYGPGMIRHQGRDLVEVSFSILLISSLITETSLLEQLDDIKTMWKLGEYSHLIFGGQVFGEFPFIITSISEKNSYFNKENLGFDVVELDLTLKEYIDNPKKYNQEIEQQKVEKNEQISEENQENIEAEQKEVIQK